MIGEDGCTCGICDFPTTDAAGLILLRRRPWMVIFHYECDCMQFLVIINNSPEQALREKQERSKREVETQFYIKFIQVEPNNSAFSILKWNIMESK